MMVGVGLTMTRYGFIRALKNLKHSIVCRRAGALFRIDM